LGSHLFVFLFLRVPSGQIRFPVFKTTLCISFALIVSIGLGLDGIIGLGLRVLMVLGLGGGIGLGLGGNIGLSSNVFATFGSHLFVFLFLRVPFGQIRFPFFNIILCISFTLIVSIGLGLRVLIVLKLDGGIGLGLRVSIVLGLDGGIGLGLGNGVVIFLVLFFIQFPVLSL